MIKLQQGETTQIAIELSKPLEADDILYYVISDECKALLCGNTVNGKITEIDRSHFVANLSSDDTFNLLNCTLELAFGRKGRSMVNIGEKGISLEFRPNKIKHTLL